MSYSLRFFFFYGSCDHRDLHVRTHSFPTRRSSDLEPYNQIVMPGPVPGIHVLGADRKIVDGRVEPGHDLNRGEGNTAHIAGSRASLSGLRMMKRSEEHTPELQSLMRISYAVFCLQKKNTTITLK